MELAFWLFAICALIVHACMGSDKQEVTIIVKKEKEEDEFTVADMDLIDQNRN